MFENVAASAVCVSHQEISMQTRRIALTFWGERDRRCADRCTRSNIFAPDDLDERAFVLKTRVRKRMLVRGAKHAAKIA